MKSKKGITHLFITFVLAFIVTVCGPSEKQKDADELSKKLQALVDSMIVVEGEDPIHNAVLLVESPRIKWKGAAGMADGKKEAMTADHKIKIASISKTFTATLIMQLIEEGFLELDDTLEKFLDNPIVKLDSLHIFEGIAYGRQITVEQLLSHTSGIKNYKDGPRFIPDVIEHPKAQYSPAKILGKYYEYQTNRKAVFPPGKGFDYSDVNYVLLAMIIERVTGETYQEQLKVRIFDRLGMYNSYLEYYEEPRGDKPLSHAYFSTMDLTVELNTSFEWGASGIVSTCEELNTFFRALLKGQLFKKESTVQQMLIPADEGNGGTDDYYGFGLGITKRSINGLTFYGHGGAFGSDVYYCPAEDISVCISLNQMDIHVKRGKFLQQAVELIM